MKQVLIAVDQVFNTLCGGWADETLSARIWRNKDNSWYWSSLRVSVDIIFFFQKNHCEQSFYSEINRSQMAKIYHQYKL